MNPCSLNSTAIHPGQHTFRSQISQHTFIYAERWRMHFTVHASEPGMVFQHAIVDRMSIGADGHFHTDQLLHHE